MPPQPGSGQGLLRARLPPQHRNPPGAGTAAASTDGTGDGERGSRRGFYHQSLQRPAQQRCAACVAPGSRPTGFPAGTAPSRAPSGSASPLPGSTELPSKTPGLIIGWDFTSALCQGQSELWGA